MPSFRVTVTIGALRPGVAPETIVPTAAAAAAEFTTVEASSVNVVRGTARVTVRFTCDDAEIAEQIARHVVTTTGAVAEPIAWSLTRQARGRWITLVRP